MDYCSSCRRTLNGALVCPGCGAYAPDIAPPHDDVVLVFPSSSAPSAHAASPGLPVVLRGSPAADRGHGGGSAGASGAYAAATRRPVRRLRPFSAAKAFDTADAGGETAAGSVDVSATVAASQGGRAARRRKLAQWKKNKRRAVAATAVAIVGGGLTIAALPNDASPDRTHASAAPDPVTTSCGPGQHGRRYGHAGRPGLAERQRPFAQVHRPAARPPGRRAHPGGVHRADRRPAPRRPGPQRRAAHHRRAGRRRAHGHPRRPCPADLFARVGLPVRQRYGCLPGTSTGSGSGSSGGTQATTPAPAPSTASPEPICVLGLLCIS